MRLYGLRLGVAFAIGLLTALGAAGCASSHRGGISVETGPKAAGRVRPCQPRHGRYTVAEVEQAFVVLGLSPDKTSRSALGGRFTTIAFVQSPRVLTAVVGTSAQSRTAVFGLYDRHGIDKTRRRNVTIFADDQEKAFVQNALGNLRCPDQVGG